MIIRQWMIAAHQSFTERKMTIEKILWTFVTLAEVILTLSNFRHKTLNLAIINSFWSGKDLGALFGYAT